MVQIVPFRTLQRSLVLLAALVCLLFTSTLLDTPALAVTVHMVTAPPLPDSIGDRDGSLVVDLKDPNGKPVKGARVTILLLRDNVAYLAGDKETDAAGHVQADRLPQGELWVIANGQDMARASTRLVLGSEPKSVALVARPAGRLSVRVLGDDDKPIANATVEVRCADPLPFVGRTDRAGNIGFDRLCPAPYQVRASADGHEAAKRGSVVPGPLPLRMVLKKLGSILVSVVTSDGNPAPLATVYLAGAGVWPARQTQSNALGEALIGGLPAGAYDLRATRGALASAILSGLSVQRGEKVEAKLTL